MLNFFAEKELRDMNKTVAQLNLLKFSTIKKFKRDFDRKFSKLQKLEKEAQDVIETGSGSGIIKTYKLLSDSYTGFAKELEKVVRTGLNKEHIKAFRKDLSSPINASYQAAKTYKKEAIDAIRKNQILSKENTMGWCILVQRLFCEYCE